MFLLTFSFKVKYHNAKLIKFLLPYKLKFKI